MLVAVVAVVMVAVTAFISGSDTDRDASTSCKPADAKIALRAAAVLLTSTPMLCVV
jgi:hypothetical protein